MRGRAPLFSSLTPHWSTPAAVYEQLNAEFHFTHDPCPLFSDDDGLSQAKSWVGENVYCNPPYGRGIGDWLARAREAALAVFLLPARTDTRWFHEYCLHADEIRFVRGRLKFGQAVHNAPFPSMVVIFHPADVRALESRKKRAFLNTITGRGAVGGLHNEYF